MRIYKVSLTAAVLLGAAFAFSPISLRAQSGNNASMLDKHFVSEALKGGMAEVEMGRLAAEKDESSDVRQFGQKMVEDHTKLGDQMKQVASQIGVAIPKSPTLLQQAEIKKLRGLSGNQFDQEYIRTMVKDHEQDLKDFRKEADTGKSSLVKNAASQGADVISSHLSIIKRIAATHNLSVK